MKMDDGVAEYFVIASWERKEAESNRVKYGEIIG
jgi:hypothetical protein